MNTEVETEGDQLYVAMVRVPKWDKEVKSTIDYTKLRKEHSKLKIVKSFKHEGDISKARAMH